MIWNGMTSFVQNRCKIHEKRGPGPSKLHPEAPKIEVGDALESQDAHKRCFRPVQRGPRGAQEAPKKRSRAPKRCPRDACEGPGGSKPPLKSRPARSERVPDAFGCVQGARGEPVLEKSVVRSLCGRVWFCFFDDRSATCSLNAPERIGDAFRPCRA